MSLGSGGDRPGLGPVRRFDEIDSTNRYLADEARAGAPHGLVAVAKHQTAGRGRLGRRWEAPPGANLLVSILLRPEVLRPSGATSALGPPGPEAGPQAYTLAVALSAADACGDVAGVHPGLKWPNDLVVDDRKLAGVLAETVGPKVAQAVVVGLGLNVGWPQGGESAGDAGADPDADAGAPWAVSLAGLTGRSFDSDLLLDSVLEHLAGRITGLLEPGGLSRQSHEYLTRCVTLNRAVRVEEHSESFTGIAAGISEDGQLIVETASGRRVVTAGDVIHLRHR